MSQLSSSKESSLSFALIIDGKSLSFALDKNLENSFLELALGCASVICCRSSPKQKAVVSVTTTLFFFPLCEILFFLFFYLHPSCIVKKSFSCSFCYTQGI